MAPQAAVRRRGGTHRVKDADLTNTKFDNYNYQELKDECIERGLWIKDMKKVAMAQALAKNESEKKQTENAARHEKANREHWAALQKQREDERKLKEGAEKRKKQMEKQKRREIDGNVSEDTMDEELEQMHEQILEATGNQRSSDAGGEWLSSEESWRSDSTDTTFHSTEPPILPQDRLRLFEWTYIEMPSPVARSAPSVLPSIDFNSQMNLPSSPTNMFVREPPVPRNIPYVPLKVYTTETKQKLFLPGLTYPPNIDPDYVPVLTQQTRDAARNGVLEGVLRKATIERASAWSARTQIQGWNARMFFNLPPCNPSKKLPDVYTKWCSKNRELFDVKPGTVGFKVNRRQRHVQRHAQRHKNKSKRQAEVLEASEYRPAAVCYIPAYLDFGESENRYSREESGHILENLFFICFPGCDVPHYYFWVRKGQWADPTKPNPGWTPQDEDADDQDKSTDESENESDTPQSARYSISPKRLPKLARRTRKALVRVKNDATPPSPVSPSVPPSIANTLEHFRYELYTYGLSATLSKCRMKWVRNGKEDAWTAFSKDMPLRYPNGKLPDTPPVDGKGVVSLTMKLASIELVGIKTKLSPFTGDEPWTEDDDDLWSVVEIRVEDTGTSVEDVTSEKVDMNQDMEVLDPKDLEALYRRSSFQPLSRLSSNDCAAWLTQVSPSFIPLSPGSLPTSPVLEDVDTLARKEWEDLFMQQAQRGLDVLCPFCSQRLSGFSFEDQATHMYSHSVMSPVRQRRRPSTTHPLVTPSLASRKPSRYIATCPASYYVGTDSETDNAPTPLRTYTKTVANSPKRRFSQLTYTPPSTPSSHIPSPYLPHFTRYPPRHPNVAWQRRNSAETLESLEFLSEHAFKRQKMAKEKVNVVAVKYGGAGGPASPTTFWRLERKRSRVLEAKGIKKRSGEWGGVDEAMGFEDDVAIQGLQKRWKAGGAPRGILGSSGARRAQAGRKSEGEGWCVVM